MYFALKWLNLYVESHVYMHVCLLGHGYTVVYTSRSIFCESREESLKQNHGIKLILVLEILSPQFSKTSF